MAGFSGPVSIAGAAALQNAEILAGIVLSQLTAPGTPVEISDAAIDADLIISVGQGEYLTHPKTFAAFNSLAQPVLCIRS